MQPIGIENMGLKRRTAITLLEELNHAFSEHNVAAGHRTIMTELALGEIMANAASLRPADAKTTEYFRSTILPQVGALGSQFVEVMSVDVDRLTRITFSYYSYRCDQAYPPKAGGIGQDIETFYAYFDPTAVEALKTYPNFRRCYSSLEWQLKNV